MMRARLIIYLAAIAIAALVAVSPAAAQVYPSRPITIVVPFPAGAVTDITARILADRMKESLGQAVLVVNVTGAGGTLAVGRVARATADGYTLSLGDLTSHVSSSAIFAVPYDVLGDLAPVALLPSVPQLLVGKNAIPAQNLKELIAWLKANSDKVTVALPGALGSGGHLSAIDLQASVGTQFQIVPYRGAAPAIQDLVAGHADMLFVNASTALPFVRSGQVRAFGVTTEGRWAAAREIPTLAEGGVPLYFSLWQGLWAPRGTPTDVIARLSAAVGEALADSTVRARLTELGQDVPPRERQTAEALAVHHKAQIDKWWPIIKAAKIKPE